MTHASLCKETYGIPARFQCWKPQWIQLLGVAALLLLPFSFAGHLSAQCQTGITPASIPNATVGTSYSVQLTENEPFGGGFPVAWGVASGALPPGLTLDRATMSVNTTISGTPTAAGSYTFTVEAQFNASAPTLSCQTYTIVVASGCTLTVTPASPLPQGDVGRPYLRVQLLATGCSGTYTFSAPSNPFSPPTFPPGLTLSNTGSITGTPTTAGIYDFTLVLSDLKNNQTSFPYSITINPAPSITTASPLPNGSVGVPYSEQLAATGGVPPYTFHMSGNPAWLTLSAGGLLSGTAPQAGTLNLNLGVSDTLGGQTVSPFQLTFATNVSQLQVAPLSLTFNADPNGSHPPNQAVSIVPATGATLPANFHLVIDNGQDGGAAPDWISVFPHQGTAPASLVVNVNPANLAAGTYPARIQVVDSNGLSTAVSVAFNVASIPQQLTVAPSILNFAARAAAPGTLVDNLVVSNSGTGSLNFTTSVAGKSSWISMLGASSGTSTQNQPVFVQIQVNTNGLAVGGYQDAILVSSSAGTAQIPVSLFIAPSGSILALENTGVLFQTIEGGGSTATQSIEVLNFGDPSSTVNWTATLTSGSNWLNLVSSSGTATSTTPGTLTLALAPNATALSPGSYYATVRVTDSKSANSPQYITAVLNLEPTGSPAAPYLDPVGLFFTTTAGGSAPAAQHVQVNTSSSTPVAFNAAATSIGNGTWLSVTPESGSASGQTAGSISISVNPTGLAAGIYTGDVTVSIDTLIQSVNVTFVVQPRSSTTAISHALSVAKPQVAGCTASQLAITETGLANNFAVPAGWPATLIVQLNNDCAASVTNGNVVASFSNGDAPLNLAGDELGNYSATWQPGAINANMVVTLNATAPSLAAATAKLYGGIATNQTPPPTIAPGGTLNNLNPVVGAPLAPGTIAQVYGSGLAANAVSTGVLPLPTTFNNTFALVGPAQAPLYFLSGGQINIQIPNEAAATQQLPIVLSVNNALTLPAMLNIVPAAPGVLSYNDGPKNTAPQNGAHIIAQHADGSLVSSSKPAKPGEYLVMYLVGLGATNPTVPSGTATPASPLHNATVQPTVTIGSQSAKVAFAGLTPFFVALYQINFQVPTGASSGELEVDVSQNGVAANPTLLPVSQ